MNNMPELKIGVVAVSRDCFPESLSVTRRANLMKAYTEKYGEEGIYPEPEPDHTGRGLCGRDLQISL